MLEAKFAQRTFLLFFVFLGLYCLSYGLGLYYWWGPSNATLRQVAVHNVVGVAAAAALFLPMLYFLPKYANVLLGILLFWWVNQQMALQPSRNSYSFLIVLHFLAAYLHLFLLFHYKRFLNASNEAKPRFSLANGKWLGGLAFLFTVLVAAAPKRYFQTTTILYLFCVSGFLLTNGTFLREQLGFAFGQKTAEGKREWLEARGGVRCTMRKIFCFFAVVLLFLLGLVKV